MLGRLTFRDGLVGLMIGTDLSLRSTAMALLFFAGALQQGAPVAVTVFVVASLISTAYGLLRLGIPLGFTITQSEPLAVLLPGAGVIAAAGLAPEVSAATGFAFLGLTAIATGAMFLLVAHLRYARFVRLVPYPVVVGFLGATGALLIHAALRSAAPGLMSFDLTIVDPAELLLLAMSVGWPSSSALLK